MSHLDKNTENFECLSYSDFFFGIPVNDFITWYSDFPYPKDMFQICTSSVHAMGFYPITDLNIESFCRHCPDDPYSFLTIQF